MKNLLDNMIIGGIPEIRRIDEWTALSEQKDIAFEYNDFFIPSCLNDETEYKRRVKIYQGLNRRPGRDTLHGAFFDIAVNSEDRLIRELCRRRCEESVVTALSLNCRGVVFHTNYIVGFQSEPYRNDWVKKCAEFYHELAERYPQIDILVENMFDDSPNMLGRLAAECRDLPNFGVCFDASHAAVWNRPMKEWTDVLGRYVKHIHLNDSIPPADSHLPLGEGTMRFDFLKEKPFPIAESVLLEVQGIDNFRKSYEYLEKL